MSAPRHAIVVLGARVRPDGSMSPTLEARLREAHAAFQAGEAARIVVTGHGEAEPMRRWLLDAGIPEAAIFVEAEARSTRDNARCVARMVPTGAELLVVTQDAHLPRALALFRAAGLKVEGRAAEAPFSRSARVRELLAYAHHWLLRWI